MNTIARVNNYWHDCTHHIKNRSNFCVGSGEPMLQRGCWHIQSSWIVLCAREDQGCLNETAFSLLPPCKSTSRLDCITQPWFCYPVRLFHGSRVCTEVACGAWRIPVKENDLHICLIIPRGCFHQTCSPIA